MELNETNNIIEELPENVPISLQEKIANMPGKPGVYLYKNEAGKIIYVGKAKNLRNRVRSYFQSGRPVDAKTRALIAKIVDLETIIVDSEAEAFILEDTLIKKHKPRYNVLLRDDKSFPFVRITNEPCPRIFATRKIIRDGSKYFGPFTEVRPMKQLIRTLRSLFFLRTCDLKITEEAIAKKKFKVCLDYHIKKCEGPCEGFITLEKYRENVKLAYQILNGKTKDLEKLLEARMLELSEDMRFEEAAELRNRLFKLKEYTSRQKIFSTELIDRDIFGIARVDDLACSLVFKIRDGKLTGKRHYMINNALEQTDESILARTLESYYLESEFIPKELFLPCEPEQFEYLLDWLNKTKGQSLSVSIPKVGDKKKFVEMAVSNAELIIREYMAAMEQREQTVPRSLLSLQRDLRLEAVPHTIECFDNSHLQGTDLVSSLVVFREGKPSKKDYRKFKISTEGKNDDFASMKEVVHRRYKRLIEENNTLPDLIVVDGGKGQLSSACEILDELNITNKVKIIGLAKRLEEVFVPGNSDPIVLPRTSGSLRLLQQIRDEAHRFAITFHKQLRSKRTLQTQLTEIEGIGDATSKKLLIKFGSVENIRNADLESLKEIVSERVALAIKDKYIEYKKNY
ncbi:MAG: uvrC [Ignavibacteria bacterium]|nr:uvrC [Ignavibacteria bacterium]